jgi:death-on-curing protein
VEAYPDFATKAAVLCWHLVKNHPLPDGNKRCAFLATVEFVERNRRTWVPAPGDPDETDRVIRAVASGDLSQGDFRDWIADRCGRGLTGRKSASFRTGDGRGREAPLP